MIEGNFYKGSDLQVTLETEIDMSTALAMTMLATFTGGPTKEYTGVMVNNTSVMATIPQADNIYPGEIVVRATATFSVTGKKIGDPDQLYILDVPTPS